MIRIRRGLLVSIHGSLSRVGVGLVLLAVRTLQSSRCKDARPAVKESSLAATKKQGLQDGDRDSGEQRRARVLLCE